MSDGTNLANEPFDYSFNGKTYQIKKANLSKLILLQRKQAEIQKENDAGGDIRVIAYALYLTLHSVDETVTEEYILENCPADIDVAETLFTLGFMNQQKYAQLQRMAGVLVNQTKK